MGDTTDMGLGSSGMGNGSIGTSYGAGSTNATTGIDVDSSGFSDRDVVASGGGRRPDHYLALHGQAHPMK